MSGANNTYVATFKDAKGNVVGRQKVEAPDLRTAVDDVGEDPWQGTGATSVEIAQAPSATT